MKNNCWLANCLRLPLISVPTAVNKWRRPGFALPPRFAGKLTVTRHV